MAIFSLTLDYHTANIDQRADFEVAVRSWLAAEPPIFAEHILLATCNRVELYVVAADVGRVGAVSAEIQKRTGEDALRHLSRVACGLESIVPGEPQILGQVRDALETATANGTVGAHLRTAFQTAIRAGKRVRSETAISRNALSVASVALRMARQKLGSLNGRHVVIVGAGKMAQLTVKAMRHDTPASLTVLNRTPPRAAMQQMIDNGSFGTLDQLETALQTADLVVTATGATEPLIDLPMMQRVMASRSQPLLLVDVAAPRDIATQTASLPGVELIDVDALREHAAVGLQERKRAIPAVEAIIEHEIQETQQAFRAIAARPLIRDLRSRAEQIRQCELERTLRKMPNLDSRTRLQLERFSESLIKKLFHEPTVRLREEAGNQAGEQYAATVRTLFGL